MQLICLSHGQQQSSIGLRRLQYRPPASVVDTVDEHLKLSFEARNGLLNGISSTLTSFPALRVPSHMLPSENPSCYLKLLQSDCEVVFASHLSPSIDAESFDSLYQAVLHFKVSLSCVLHLRQESKRQSILESKHGIGRGQKLRTRAFEIRRVLRGGSMNITLPLRASHLDFES